MTEFFAQLQTAGGPELISGLSAVLTVAFWLRIEHRLTRLETRFDDLPCKSPSKPASPACSDSHK